MQPGPCRQLLGVVALAGLAGCTTLGETIHGHQQGLSPGGLAALADETEAFAGSPPAEHGRAVAEARSRAEGSGAHRDTVRLALLLLEPDTAEFDPGAASELLESCAGGPQAAPLCRILHRLATHVDDRARHDARAGALDAQLGACLADLASERAALQTAADEARARSELLVSALRQQTEAAMELRRKLDAIRNIESTLEQQRQSLPDSIDPDQIVEPDDDDEQADPSG